MVHLITSSVPAAGFPGCIAGVPSQVCFVSILGRWSPATNFLTDVNRPGSQEDLVSNWEPTCGLVGNAVSGAEFAPYLPALAVTRLPPCLQRGWAGPQLANSPLVFAQSFVLWAGLAVCLVRAFRGKVLFLFPLFFFFSSLWLSHSLGCYLTLPPSDCPQGVQAQSLP